MQEITQFSLSGSLDATWDSVYLDSWKVMIWSWVSAFLLHFLTQIWKKKYAMMGKIALFYEK